MDAACIGESGKKIKLNPNPKLWIINGSWKVVITTVFLAPPARIKRVDNPGDFVLQPKGGIWAFIRIRWGIWAHGCLDAPTGKITAPWYRFITTNGWLYLNLNRQSWFKNRVYSSTTARYRRGMSHFSAFLLRLELLS